MPPPEFGHTLRGFTLNVLVRDMERAVQLQRDVFGTTIVYSDADITIVRYLDAQWMIHTDHTYDKHQMTGYMEGVKRRGVGAEFRLHGIDPDSAEAKALANGFKILSPARDQPDHGLREVHIIDDEGYVWVADVRIGPA